MKNYSNTILTIEVVPSGAITQPAINMFKVNNRSTRTKVRNMFIVNNKDTKTTPKHISHLCCSVSIVNFEQVNAVWVVRISTQITIYIQPLTGHP